MIDLLRSLVRPLITVLAFVIISTLALMGKVGAAEYMAFAGPFVAWWFASRANRG